MYSVVAGKIIGIVALPGLRGSAKRDPGRKARGLPSAASAPEQAARRPQLVVSDVTQKEAEKPQERRNVGRRRCIVRNFR